MSISKNKKIITISVIVLLIILTVLIFPKEVSTCGHLTGEKACIRHRCMGILNVTNHNWPIVTCTGIDLGEEAYYIPLN